MKIYLASKSPRRQELLKKIYSRFEIIPPEVKEEGYSLNPMELVLTLSRQKAENVAAKVKEGVIVAADTVVAVDGKVLGKPRDEEEAYFMLKTLSGREHDVYTGVTLMEQPQKREKSFVEATKVWFYPLTEEEIKNYIDSREPFDKAGAYGIQGKGALFVARIEGCYFNVVGLPVARLYRELREWGY